jgi:hypothetical protein
VDDAHCEFEMVNAAPAPERLKSPLEIREVRLRGLHRDLPRTMAAPAEVVIEFDPQPA